jgi:hypothetical protein
MSNRYSSPRFQQPSGQDLRLREYGRRDRLKIMIKIRKPTMEESGYCMTCEVNRQGGA